jgi:DedD protein
VDERRTHYQLSFTSRQALLLFVGLVVALGVAYTLGVMTGLAGRPREAAPVETRAAVEPTPAPTAAPAATPAGELEVPKPVRGVPARAGAPLSAPVAGREPGSVTRMGGGSGPVATPAPAATPPPELHMFEDEGGAPPPAKPSPAQAHPAKPAAPAAAAASNAFWVQVLSASSSKEAAARRERLSQHGFPSAVVPGEGPGGSRVYRVRVGPYKTREDADRAAMKLKSREKLEPWVVPPGK